MVKASEQATVGAERAVQRCIEPECDAVYGLDERLYVCARCGGLLDVEKERAREVDVAALRAIWTARLASSGARDRSGVWRYRELLPFDDDAPVVTLAEGNTPLYDAPRSARYCGLDALTFKHQGCNPTGSFKDTGMTTAVTQARRLGVRLVVCASTGNTSASLAAYAARAGLACAILVPHGQVSHAKLAQSLDYGAAVLELEGNFDDAMRVIRELSEDEAVYLVNSINPFRIEGQKTVAVELVQQLGWRVPNYLVVPGGNLGNSAAFGKGLMELFTLGVIERLPRLVVVQAEGAAPFARLFPNFRAGDADAERTSEVDSFSGVFETIDKPQTLATAIKIGAPVSWKKALRAVRSTAGHALSVSEQEIADAKAVIGRDGIGCEPASATTLAGIKRLVAAGVIDSSAEVVAVLTGHILKDTDYAINYHRDALHAHDENGEEKRRLKSAYANPPARVRPTRTAILEQLKRSGHDLLDIHRGAKE